MFWLLHKPKSGSEVLFIHPWMSKKARVARKLKEGFECLIFEEVTLLKIFLSGNAGFLPVSKLQVSCYGEDMKLTLLEMLMV